MLRLQIVTALRPAASSARTVPQMAFDGHWRDALGKDPTNRAYSLANPSNVTFLPIQLMRSLLPESPFLYIAVTRSRDYPGQTLLS